MFKLPNIQKFNFELSFYSFKWIAINKQMATDKIFSTKYVHHTGSPSLDLKECYGRNKTD